MPATLDGQILTLSGFVGDNWWDEGFTYDEVMVALASVEDDSELDVFINSGGGYATEGAAIHALLARRSGTTNVIVDGVAASAASLIAMAGETVTMSAGSIMMIHDPAGISFGTSADHQKAVEALEALATAYARVYAAKSGKTADECREIMKAESWMTPEQAIAEGFADAANDNEASAVAAFDYRAYAHAPDQLRAVASANGWSLKQATRKLPTASAPAPTGHQKEKPIMIDKTKADTQPANIEEATATAAREAVKADRERHAAIMALEEAKGREQLAAHLHATTEMSVDEVKAALAAAPATSTEEKPSAAAYDKSRAAAGAGLAAPGSGEGKPKSGLSELITARIERKRA
ncbi:head maturation protease, ClpP-related [Hoeflea alexandrii]|uniref:ATP-dependent Clp protease proteolytic subunit n=1 Tax=Hoeflea alexandrii TaxID=288436 RepID=A0ABT1CXM5_9HYPH|nr:head maturation protease, ClpP-related [Hoeflea alexandrii]MCO6410091.1 Clp protease ClpP [Hoeflea alexandrii]MCY0153064.1 Clp protease ClpP [Hoeflea alexandrii]